MKKSETNNACTCHCWIFVDDKSSSEAWWKYDVQISPLNLDTIPLCAGWIGLSIHHESVPLEFFSGHNPSCSRICRFPCYVSVYSVMHRHVRFPLLWGRVGVSAKQSNKYLAVPFWSVRKGSLWSLSWKTRHTYDQSMFFSVDRWFGKGKKNEMAHNFRFGQWLLLP